MRQSVATNRVSHAASSQVNSAAAAAKLVEKKKEFEAVSALEKSSALFLRRIEGLGEDCDIMADAGESELVSKVTYIMVFMAIPQLMDKFSLNGQTCSGY
jgi:hypothetical protein